MNPSSPKKKSNTVSWFIVMVFVIILGISAFLVWKWQHDAANARLAQRLTEIQVSDAGKIRYEAGDEKIHVLTPYYSFDLPISWLGYCSLEYQRMDETYDWSDCYYVFSDAQHDPDTYRIIIRYQYPHDNGGSHYLGTIELYNELFNYGNFLQDEREGRDSTRKYFGRLKHVVDGRTYYAHMALLREAKCPVDEDAERNQRCTAMYEGLRMSIVR